MERKAVSGIMLTLLLTSAFALLFKPVPCALGSPQVLFEEDFESYAVDSFPSDKFDAQRGGWSVTEEGGNKFLRSVPYTDSSYELITLQKFPGDVTIEFLTRHSRGWLYVCIAMPYGVPGPGGFAFAISTDGTQYGIYYHWTSDGIDYVSGMSILGTFTTQPNIWYKGTLKLVGTFAEFYVNDSFVFEFDISTVIPFQIENFHMYWSTWGQRDLDNIKVSTLLLSPLEALEELVQTVESWSLPKGTENSLTSKLEDALHLLNIGNENGATHKLMDFINQVDALRDKKLTNEQADQLASEAQRIINLINE